MTAKLSVNNISFSYDYKEILSDITLSLNSGLYAILGPNGAGKTTLLRLISGLITPTHGNIFYCDKNVSTIGKDYTLHIGYLPQKLGLIQEYTTEQYLEFIASLKAMRPMAAKHRIKQWLDFFDMAHFWSAKISSLSIGEQQKVGIIQALLNDPDILILDEPTSWLDPNERMKLLFMLEEVSKTKLVLLSTHNIEDVAHVPSQILILHDSKIVVNARLSDITEGTNSEKALEQYYFKIIGDKSEINNK